jgi:hypothetical protein
MGSNVAIGPRIPLVLCTIIWLVCSTFFWSSQILCYQFNQHQVLYPHFVKRLGLSLRTQIHIDVKPSSLKLFPIASIKIFGGSA